MILQMRSTAGAERYCEFHYKVTNTYHSVHDKAQILHKKIGLETSVQMRVPHRRAT